MHLNRRAGFTLVELVVAVSVAGVLAAGTLRVIILQYQVTAQQRARADAGATLRAASLMLTDELRRLGADSIGSDIVRLGPTGMQYRAVRNTRFVCGVVPGSGSLVLERAYRGTREIDPRRDSLSVYLPGTGRWRTLAVTGVAAGTCPNGSPGVTVRVTGLTGGVGVGSPVRAFAQVELRGYRGGDGRWWIGMRAFAGGRWPSIQPLLGPIRSGGLEITGFDVGGNPTTNPSRVVSLEVRVTTGTPRRSSHRVLASSPSTTLVVAVRNGLE